MFCLYSYHGKKIFKNWNTLTVKLDVNNIPKNVTCKKMKNRASVNITLCKKHGKEGSLFCLNHNASNICSDCFYKSHLNCQVKPSKYKENIVGDVLSKLTVETDRVNKDIQQKEDELVKMIKEKLFNIKVQAMAQITKKRDTILKIIDKKRHFESIVKDINAEIEKITEIEKNQFQIEFLTSNDIKPAPEEIILRYLPFNCLNGYEGILPNDLEKESFIRIDSVSGVKKIFLPEMPEFCFIFKRLKCYQNLANIECNQIRIGEEELKDVFQALKFSCQTLKCLSFVGCDLSYQQGCDLAILLQKCFHLESISLKSNINLKESLSRIFDGLIGSSPNLKFLDFSSCKLDHSCEHSLIKLLHGCSKIESFYFAMNKIDEDNLKLICQTLTRSNSSLKNIDFSGCDLTDLSPLEELLEVCTKIEYFNISCNKNMYDTSELWVTLNKSSSFLKKLNVSFCNLNQSEGHSLGNLLTSCKIECINISLNPGMKTGLIYIIKSVQNSSFSLKELEFDSENLVENQCNGFKKYLSNFKELNTLTISFDELKNNEKVRRRLSSFCDDFLASSDALKEIKYIELRRLESHFTFQLMDEVKTEDIYN